MKLLKLIKHLLFFIVLTLITQVGGLIWLFSVWISQSTKKKKRYIFPVLYLFCNLIIIPPIAKLLGREKLPVFDKTLKPIHWCYPLLFRNYVDPKLKVVLQDTAHVLFISKAISINYLDANFPFFDGFPLLPHLSHNDGKKIDISLLYLDKNNNPTPKKPSRSGYGVYVSTENKTYNRCITQGYWHYDFSKYITFGTKNNLKFDKKNTKILIAQLISNSSVNKIYIEPYLKTALGFSEVNKIRFHGCKAVRHDDHIHLEIK